MAAVSTTESLALNVTLQLTFSKQIEPFLPPFVSNPLVTEQILKIIFLLMLF